MSFIQSRNILALSNHRVRTLSSTCLAVWGYEVLHTTPTHTACIHGGEGAEAGSLETRRGRKTKTEPSKCVRAARLHTVTSTVTSDATHTHRPMPHACLSLSPPLRTTHLLILR